MDLCSGEGKILNARFSADGKYVVTLTKLAVKIWNIAKRKVSWSIDEAKGFQVSSKTFILMTSSALYRGCLRLTVAKALLN